MITRLLPVLLLIACGGSPEVTVYRATWDPQIGKMPRLLAEASLVEIAEDRVCFMAPNWEACADSTIPSDERIEVEGIKYGPEDLDAVEPFWIRFYPHGQVVAVIYPVDGVSAIVLYLDSPMEAL